MPASGLAWRIGLAVLGVQAAAAVLAAWLLRAGSVERWSDLRALALPAVALLLPAPIIAFLLARSVGKAISAVTAAATGFASGNRRARAPDHPSDELSRLSATLNQAAERLTGQIVDLRAQTRQQEAILQSMEGGVIALDQQQRILRVNRAAERMLGTEAEAARGRLLQEVAREPGLNQFVAQALADPTVQSGEFELRGDHPASVRAASGSLRNAEGRPVGLLVVLNDVTQLRRLETMRTDFAANVSHELRTPITNIKGYVETLLEIDPADREQAQNFLRIIAKNAERLGSIVEDMLTLTRLESSDAAETLVTTPIPVARVVDSVLLQLDGAARSKSMVVEADVPLSLRARMNEQLVEQALANLVINAIKYSPARTRVAIQAREADDAGARTVEIAVIDEGPGIAPEHLSRIFERFYRVDRARSREQGGTGLGLAIVKHIALVHGGRVEAESAPGRGSTFRLVLPAA